MKGKALIFSAPSGSGKSTIIDHLLREFSNLEFSISATSRAPRGVERDGVDYYFMSQSEFSGRVENGEFLEWEEVYAGTSYGTLRAEIDRIWSRGNIVIFDIDVLGSINIKRLFGDAATSIFIMPPSVEELRNRLTGRATDTPEAIERRVARAEEEITYAQKFDKIIINDKLEDALKAATELVAELGGKPRE